MFWVNTWLNFVRAQQDYCFPKTTQNKVTAVSPVLFQTNAAAITECKPELGKQVCADFIHE